MKSNTAFFVFIVGFLLTAGGVGGIETSVNDSDLLGAMLISILGLMIMYCGTAAMKVSDYYDR